MIQVAITWDAVTRQFDLTRENGLIELDGTIWSAVFDSLFRDAHSPDESLPGHQRRGYWATNLSDDPIPASLLWTLVDGVVGDEFARLWQQYADAALAWMVDDGVAKSVTTTTEVATRSRIEWRTDIISSDDARYEATWSVTAGAGVIINAI